MPPPVGGWPRDGETPRQFNARMRSEQPARKTAEAQAEDVSHPHGCFCYNCLARRAPRPQSRHEFSVFNESTWAPHARGGAT